MKGNSESVDPLIAALKDSSAQVRAQAAWALGMKGAQRAIEPLNAAMKDENRQVRQNAAWALGMLLINTRDLKINVKLDNKMKFDPNEIEREEKTILMLTRSRTRTRTRIQSLSGRGGATRTVTTRKTINIPNLCAVT